MAIRLSYLWACLLVLAPHCLGQCPWHRDIDELQSSCICAYNLGHELSVQCDMVDFPRLLTALDQYARKTPLDLLYVNNSTVYKIEDGAFKNLRLHNVQLSGCRIRSIAPGAFLGQEGSLRNLNLQDNELGEVPVESLRQLANLSLLDLSRNRIARIPDEAFMTLQSLSTLKLADNNVTLSSGAFRGLDGSLKNLNLKGTRQKRVPDAIRGLRTLAFLDLAQNGLRELPGPGGASVLEGLQSLTALNLERNLIQSVGKDAFVGVKETLSSLSLLNNLLTDFPKAAIRSLTELRVLDIGFNLLTELPVDSFSGTPSLTLLALDGNPLATVPELALAHLNNTLRGLSLGGRFLNCDCRLRWVADWIRKGDLQVTSRERNPQFCGMPGRLKERGFYSIASEEFRCGAPNDLEDIAIVTTAETNKIRRKESQEEPEDEDDGLDNAVSLAPVVIQTPPTTTATTTTERTTPPTTTTTEQTTTTRPATTRRTTTKRLLPTTTEKPQTTTRRGNVIVSRTTVPPPWRAAPGNNAPPQRPPLVTGGGFPARPGSADEAHEVMVRNAYRQDSSVVIQWDSETANILGFRVVYRLFGDKSFKQGPPLEASEREFKIKNVPSQECIVVCVISLEEVNVTPENVPYAQCREVRTVTSPTSNMDKITIAASAAICGTVVIAVIVFVAASRRRSRKLHTLSGGGGKGGGGMAVGGGGMPVSCCAGMGASPSPGGPLSSLATLNAFTNHKDWDQVSVYSNRSIPRPRAYIERQSSLINGGCVADDMRSHASHFSSKGKKPRSIADGQSQHSFSNHSGRYLSGNAYTAGLINSRPELRQSRQSLAAASDRMSRISYSPSHQAAAASVAASSRRQRPRSRARDSSQSGRPGSRYSTAGSTHTLNNYGDTSDNWTDHDMDIYMARNPTTRGGLVPL